MDVSARIEFVLALIGLGVGLTFGGYELEPDHLLLARLSYVFAGGCVAAAIALSIIWATASHDQVVALTMGWPKLPRVPLWAAGWLLVPIAVALLAFYAGSWLATLIPAPIPSLSSAPISKLLQIQEPTVIPEKDRIFVTKTIDELMQPFESYTQEQAVRINSIYVGKWIRLLIVTHNVGTTDFDRSFITATGPLRAYGSVLLEFNPSWRERVSVIDRGDHVEAVCQITAFRSGIDLQNCELIKAWHADTPTPTAAASATQTAPPKMRKN